MAKARFSKAKITGINTVIGPISRNINEEEVFLKDPAQLERIKKTLGLECRFIAPSGITALDLCRQSAEELMKSRNLSVNEIDAIIFVTQTPDYWQPCNACLIHGQMLFPKSTAAFDVNQGCSGWIYGLYLAYSMVEAGGCDKILLLAGDTVSKTVNPKDKAIVSLFGDAGSATLIERTEEDMTSWFFLHTDGKEWQTIHIPAGGYRHPKSPLTSTERQDDEGNIRSTENLFVDGLEVFNLTLREEPESIRKLLEFSNTTISQVDYFVFHQANKLILENLAKRIKVDYSKVPMETSRKYGNQSCASIPATLCEALSNQLRVNRKLVACSGFGVGLSWASCLIDIGPLFDCSITKHNVINPRHDMRKDL